MKKLIDLYDIDLLNFASNSNIINYITNYNQELRSINFIYFANYVLLKQNKEYLQAMRETDVVLVDGIGLQMFLQILNNCDIYNNNGTDLLPLLLNHCFESNINIAFYGTNLENITKCFNKYKCNKNLYYFQHGYSELDWCKIQDNSFLFIGLGSPKQEIWQLQNKEMIVNKNITVFGVGGFFDFCSEYYKRAPQVYIDLKIEWLYRLLQHPKQHFKKYCRNIKIFYYLFLAYFHRFLKSKTN